MGTTTTSPTDIGATVAITNAKVTKPDSVGVHLTGGWLVAPPPPGRPVERTRGHEEDERE